jgi:hypothetical protein
MNDERRDILISRIVEGDADLREWDEFVGLAERDDTLWRAAVEAQRDQAELEGVMSVAADVAARVEATRPAPMPVVEVRTGRPRRHSDGWRGAWAGWTGWALAAALILAWSAGLRFPTASAPKQPVVVSGPPTAPPPAMSQAGVIPVATASDAFDAYLEKGRAELIFIHQIMEKTVVPSLFRADGLDEQGRPAFVPYEQPVRGRM